MIGHNWVLVSSDNMSQTGIVSVWLQMTGVLIQTHSNSERALLSPSTLEAILSDCDAEEKTKESQLPAPPYQLQWLPQQQTPPSCFALPFSDEDVEKMKQATVPNTTKRDTHWCARSGQTEK